MPMKYLNPFAVQCFEDWDVCFSIMRDVGLHFIVDLFFQSSFMLKNSELWVSQICGSQNYGFVRYPQ